MSPRVVAVLVGLLPLLVAVVVILAEWAAE
jgi:hypothetical protein